MRYVFLFLSCLALASCDILGLECGSSRRPADRAGRVSIQQGVWGQVWLWEGNFMPGGCTSGRVQAVSRTVLVYEATPDSMVEYTQPYGRFIRRVRTQLVDSTRSDPDGFFQLSLPPGKYSFFVRVDSLLYANGWDASPPAGIIKPATVPAGGVTRVQLDLDWNKSI